MAPELAKAGGDAIKRNPVAAVDAFGFGCLVYEVFNGEMPGGDLSTQVKGLPPKMQSSYKRLVNPNPKSRLSTGHFCEQGRQRGSYFDSPLIKLTEGVDNLGMKDEAERDLFLKYVAH